MALKRYKWREGAIADSRSLKGTGTKGRNGVYIVERW
jgi:hypothetical protein